jgi:dihydroorotase
VSLLLRGGRVVDPSQDLDRQADVLLEDGKVVAVGKLSARKCREIIDVAGCVVTPGFVDMHVHLREPGREDKETMLTGSRAAAAGGFTSIVCMPNTTPVNDNAAITRFILERAADAGLVNVFPTGAITVGSRGEQLAEIGEMRAAGIVAVTDDGRPVQNSQVMRRAMEYARIFDLPVMDHCEDLFLAAGGCMNEGKASTRLGLRGMSRAAEELQVVRDIILSRITGARIHILHISTRESLDQVRAAKSQGIRVTCEVLPHHFTLTDGDIRNFDTDFKMMPPLREKTDVEAMLEGLADGSIDCLATDHAPHTRLDKEEPFEEAASGVIGMETAIPLCWEHLVRSGIVSVPRLVELFSLNPSRILKLGKGTLAEGADADVTVIDPDRRQVVDPSRFRSKGRNCPFRGWELHGTPVLTVVGGRVVHRQESA